MSFLGLTDKNILVTGASSGIGKETCKILASFGAKLFIAGRDKQRLTEVKEANEEVQNIFVGDLLDESYLSKMIEELPNLDGVVNCAGIIYPFPVKFLAQKHIDEVFKINFDAQVLLNSKLFRVNKINKGASIVFVSSVSSQFPYNGGALYTSSKAALEAYSRSIALEYAKNKIRSNCVSPGLVKTNIFEKTKEASDKDELEKYEKHYPLGFGDPQDVANAIAFLLSERSRWITGQNLILDGGLTLGSK